MKLINAKQRTAHPARGGWVQVGLAVLGVGLSYLSGQMLAKKNKSPIQGDKPTTLATRGSFINWFVGRRRVGPVLAWAGGREIRKEKVEGAGKGAETPESDVWYEEGWHILGVGPVYALHQIIQSGQTIMSGTITSDSHPSGTTINLGAEGSFTIYWGENGQPPNAFLGDAARLNITSRWPHACYVVWNKKRMGSSPTWPIVDYVLERRPSTTLLTGSQGWYDPGLTLSGTIVSIIGNLASATETTGYLEVAGDLTATFQPTTIFALVGNSLPDDDYEVLNSTAVQVQIGVTVNGFPIYTTRTRVFLQGGTLGSDGNGTMQPYTEDQTDGANIAHVIAEELFADFPLGLQLDPDHLADRWDLDSLDALGVEAESEGWRASVLATEGEKAEAVLASMLQDHGTLLPLDSSTGQLTFKRIRTPSGVIPAITSSIVGGKLPEISNRIGEMPVDKLLYSFSDREHGYGDMTIAIDDDGQASFAEHQRARRVAMPSTVNFDTAAKLSELRSPEEMSQASETKLEVSREARDLIPGDVITVDYSDEVQRVTSVLIDPLREAVVLRILPDYYGVPKSTYVTDPGAPPKPTANPEQDDQFLWLEVPEQMLGTFPGIQTVLVPRIRNHVLMSYTSLWLSRDDSSYTLYGTDSTVQTGGTLQAALPADGSTYVAQGPEYAELGPDNAALTQDLSSDLTNWGLGRQVCVVASTAGIEICFLQKATITGGSTRRLDGLLRARYDTRKLDHPIGAQVYIFDSGAIQPVSDALLESQVDLYVKSQPGSSSGQVNLSAVPPYGEELYGKGIRPIAPDYVQVRAPNLSSPCFQSTDDVTISWALSTGSTVTSCGFQSAGVPVTEGVIPGTVQVEYIDVGDTIQLTHSVNANDFTEDTITNAEIIAAFSGIPTSFKVRVTHVANGLASPPSPELTITLIA